MNIEQFLYHEARLLDTHQFEAWLELFTDDATYWVPLERDQKDAIETSSHIHDDRTLLGLRVQQVRHPRAHARLPLARTVHQVGNIVATADGPEIRVHSTLQVVGAPVPIVATRRGDTRFTAPGLGQSTGPNHPVSASPSGTAFRRRGVRSPVPPRAGRGRADPNR